jgi:hypothetical protein
VDLRAAAGAIHDLTAARIWDILRELAASGLVVLADKGYHGAGDHIRTPCKGRNKPESQQAPNRAHAKLRGPGEPANAQLKTPAHRVQTPLLPLAGRSARQAHPRLADPRDERTKWAHCRLPRPMAKAMEQNAPGMSTVACFSARRRLHLDLMAPRLAPGDGPPVRRRPVDHRPTW